MTVFTESSVVTILGNGVTTVFNFGFIGVSANDLQVVYTDATGTDTILPSSQYTVSLNTAGAGELWGIGGTITYPISGSPIVGGTSLTIQRLIPNTQTIELNNQGAFYPEVVEQGLDLLELQLQQTQTQVDYAIQCPVEDITPPNVLPNAVNRELTLLGFDNVGQTTLYPLNLPVVTQGNSVLYFETFPQAAPTNLAAVDYIYIAGYYKAGDGGENYWKKVGNSPPYHSVYFRSADGAYWEPATSKFDPRGFGAKADVYMLSHATINIGNLSQVIVGDSNFVGFTSADIGKNIVVYDYYAAHTLCNTTIASIGGPTVANLTVAASGPTIADSNAFYGSDDTSIINTCMTFAGSGPSGFGAGPPPVAAWNTSTFNSIGAGTHILWFRSLDRNTSRYGISNSLLLINDCTLECDENAVIWALGTFNTGNPMISQNDPTKIIKVVFDNLTLNGNGIAPVGLGPIFSVFYSITNGIKIYNCTTSGIVMGVNSGNFQTTWTADGPIYISGISTTMPGYVNNASGIGWNIVFAADGRCSGNVFIENYRTAISCNSGDVAFTGQVHLNSNTNGGYFTQGLIMGSSSIHFSDLVVDTLWGPNSGTLCYGVINSGLDNNITNYQCVVNTTAATVIDNTIYAYKYTSQNFGQTYAFPAKSGSSIGTIYTQTNNPSVKLAQIVDASLASNGWLDIGSFNSDGNYHDEGWHTLTGFSNRALSTNTNSTSNTFTSIAKSVVATTAPLWYPTESPVQTPFWLDASSFGYYDQSGGVRTWMSRNGPYKAIQSGASARPSINTSAWTGTNITTQQAFTFDGATQYMILDDIINNQTDVRMFCVMIPKATGTAGPILSLNNWNGTGSSELKLQANGTQLNATNANGSGTNHITVTANTPYLVTSIWSTTGSSGGTNGAGSTVRAFTGNAGSTNATVNSLISTNSPCVMGGNMQGNVLSNTVQFVIGEIIVVTGPMTFAQEEIYEGYLAWKWWTVTGGHSGVLTSGHPYYSAAPTA